MFDARYWTYATISALLVISPGATMAVVLKAAVEEGRAAALFTVLGVNVGNSTLALGSALGMSLLFRAWPSALHAVKDAGAVYLAYLGIRSLWLAWRDGRDTSQRLDASAAASTVQTVDPNPGAWLLRGILTNLLNPSVVLFYMTLLPQFIGPADPFFGRFLLLAGTHVSMSLTWLTCYSVAVGFLADRLTRPRARRVLEALTGAVLVGLGARMLWR